MLNFERKELKINIYKKREESKIVREEEKRIRSLSKLRKNIKHFSSCR